ncbi:hypothetical protein RJ639_019300 [Escallonia herrerae]|uniref:Alginate lyase 2 domain-containing protein n=1 Tax=Escallonia herrerae TaxID=1293975 RepID=A0AA88VAH4_9ASTE|nr:hypothetical protein RJ639_019300 [Escallonia herrerae]
MTSYSMLVYFYLSFFRLVGKQALAWGPTDPTQGFISLPFNRSYYHIQKPYDLPEDQRYSFINGIHTCCVLATDKPHTVTSQTKPRTEIGIQGYNYSSGVWQFEGYGYVPYGTSGVCIMQVFGATAPRATTLMVRVYNGSLMYYREKVLDPCIYDRWFRLNVIHDADAAKVKVFIDGYLKLEAAGRGGTSHTFKCGVYAQNNDSFIMESRWKNIKILRKWYGYVLQGTSGVCKMQVFGASAPRATTLMLRVYNESLTYYCGPVLVHNIDSRWFRINLIPDVNASKVNVFVDGVLKYKAPGQGGTFHYFKCGVKAENNDSDCMESRWKDI